MNRPINDQERAWLLQVFERLRAGEQMGGGHWPDPASGRIRPLDPRDPAPLADQLDDLRVVGQCACDDTACSSVYFQHYRRGRSVILAHIRTDDHRDLLMGLDLDSGLLSELEVI